MDGALQAFFTAGLADLSHKTYLTSEKRFLRFCNDFSLRPYPISENILCYFVTFLWQQGLSAATIKTYLSGVRQMQIAGGYADPHINLMPRLRQILKGVDVTRAKQGSNRRPWLPITPNVLRRIKRVWASPTHSHKLLWLACLIAFFGFCRSGEITIPQKGAYDPKVHLSFRDVAVDQAPRPMVVSLLLGRSKTDQSSRGVKIILGRTDHDLCPVGALMEYLMVRW